MSPQRIQLRRTRGWRKPEGAIVVARPSKWGNPWSAADFAPPPDKPDLWLDVAYACFVQLIEDRRWALANFEDPYEHEVEGCYPTLEEIRAELRGHDLCCWCPPGRDCHADLLLEIANQP
jgi:hypothetical protein